MKNRKRKPVKTFRAAVTETADIRHCIQNGLQALGEHSSKVELSDTRMCSGSVFIDECLERQNIRPGNRWDYSFAYKAEVYFVEVHSAHTGEVSTVLRKLQWLKDWLNQHAPEINKLKAKSPYYWIASGRYNIYPGSSQHKRIIQSGLNPIPKLKLD